MPFAISKPLAGNHNDFYNIEVQFEVVTATLEKASIPIEGSFLNTDAGFGAKNFKESCSKKEINANICFNKRNGNTVRDENFHIKRYSFKLKPKLKLYTNTCFKLWFFLFFSIEVR